MDQKIEIKFWKKFSGGLIDYLKVLSLPLILAVLFVLQNQMFNIWLNIYSKTYSVRLFLVTFALGVVFYGPVLLFNRRYKYIYLFLVSFIISIVFTAQFLYYSYSQNFLQFSAIEYIWEAGSAGGTIKTLLTSQMLLFFINIIVVLIAFVFTIKKRPKGYPTEFILPKWEKAIIILVMIVMVFFGYKYLLYTEKKRVGGYQQALYRCL
jgi:glucan phosphoethanolaminetransferase (alkaline phosphatase superfamily)